MDKSLTLCMQGVIPGAGGGGGGGGGGANYLPFLYNTQTE